MEEPLKTNHNTDRQQLLNIIMTDLTT